jgi:hypothetical protein
MSRPFAQIPASLWKMHLAAATGPRHSAGSADTNVVGKARAGRGGRTFTQ